MLPKVVCRVRHVLWHVLSTQQLLAVGIYIILFLEMRKPRVREIRETYPVSNS